MSCERKRCLSGFYGITGGNHDHTGEHSHKGDVFERLVGSPIGTDGDSSMRTHHLHVCIVIRDSGTNLLPIASGREHGVGGAKGNLPHCGHTRSHRHQVLLRHPNLHKSLRKLLCKRIHLRGLFEVCAQRHHPRVFSPRL